MKKWIVIVLIAALLTTGGILGYHTGYRSNHVFVENKVYEKDLTSLDLRGTGVSLTHYEEVRRQLPDCEIRYDLPFQGEFYPDDTTEMHISSLTDEEVKLLDYLPGLKTVNAENCTDYEQLMALQARRPDCAVHYLVTIGGEVCEEDTSMLSFRDKQPDIPELTEKLSWLPQMQTIFFEEPEASAEELLALQQAYPEIMIGWNKTAFGVSYPSDVTEIDLSGMIFSSPEDVVESLAYFPNLEKVIMSGCGPDEKTWFDNETMAAFREKMRPEYKVVWTVQINNMKVRTDETYFMPAKTGQVVTNFQVQNLKYCEDMVCVDLGHMAIQNISFVEGMPHLKYFIVIDAPLMYIDSISTCKELIYLEFFWTWINDFTPLLGCTALEDLNISRTNGDPMTFVDMPWLKNLWIDGFDLRMDERPILEAALPNTFIKYCDGEMTANGWRDLPNYFAMRDYLGMPYNRW